MFRQLLNWIIKLFRKEELYNYQYVDDVPDQLRSGTVYLVGNAGYYWQTVMLCPCGCSKVLYMNLMDDYNPYWKYKIVGKTISLSPSIDRTVGCRSHFFLTYGKIVWC
ncbi:DUF6527 family protein [Mucilaginibacter flavus]|uniref:DUF6527 family protein n=1 Tax=Mucilaginibacter flavus TaxID=931504 RepID=UPI0025B3D384|nr:DUF6527 family protein [Mucilaginibacter flavus]MDN3582099.1 DUF6527 family protein [Mucilaginibacter flavus]